MDKKILIGVGVLVLLAAIFLLASDEPVSSEAVPYRATAEMNTTNINVDDQFYVSVANEVVLQRTGITRESAMEECEKVAYNPDNMWKQVICVFEGEEIYNDVFVAG